MSSQEENNVKKIRRKKDVKDIEAKQDKDKPKKEPIKPKETKIKRKFKLVPLTRDELLQRTTFTIDWD